MPAVEELLAELVNLTGMSAAEWSDFCELPPDAQAVAARAYRDQDWVRSPDAFAKVLELLGVAATVAGDVSGLAGAASAIASLKDL